MLNTHPSLAQDRQTLSTVLLAAAERPEAADHKALIVEYQNVTGAAEAETALLLKLSVPTVGRYLSGVSSPHPLMRTSMYRALASAAMSERR